MKIQSIELQNFRQFINERLDFNCSDDKKITIIYGTNHIGKTTLVRAFLWCLYPHETTDLYHNDALLVSKDPAIYSKLVNEKKVTSKVTLSLEHNGFSYLIETFQGYHYDEHSDSFLPNTKYPTQKIIKTSLKDGKSLPVLADRVEREINEILPSDLKDYFFYDGENNKIDAVTERTNLKEAVRNIMHLAPREMLSDALSPYTNKGVYAMFDKDKKLDMTQNVEVVEGQIEQLAEDLERYKKEVEEDKNNAQELLAKANDLDALVEANADAGAKQKELHSAEQSLIGLQSQRENLFRELSDELDSNGGRNPGLASLFIAKAYSDANVPEQYSTSDLISLNSEHSYGQQSASAIDEIIEKGVCVCGERIVNGDEHYKHLIELKKYLRPHDYGGDLKYFEQEMRELDRAAKSAGYNIARCAAALKGNIRNISDTEDQINALKQQLKNFNGDVGKWKSDSENLKSKASNLKGRASYIESQNIPNCQRQLDECQARLSAMQLKSVENDKIDHYLAYVKEIYKLAESRLESAKNSIASTLEQKANEIFKRFGNEGVDLKLDHGNYVVKPYQNNKPIGLSTGQKAMKNFAYVAGLISLAKENNNGCLDGEDPEDYPLIMDAPFSDLSSENIEKVCAVLPQYCSQLIITLLDKDFEHAKNPLAPYVNKIYELTTNASSTNSKFQGENL